MNTNKIFRPNKPEQTYWEEDCTDHHGEKSLLGNRNVVFSQFAVVARLESYDDAAADEDADDEADVEECGADSAFFGEDDGELQWHDEMFLNEVLEINCFFFRDVVDGEILRPRSEIAGSFAEDGFLVRFFENEDVEDEGQGPMMPAPTMGETKGPMNTSEKKAIAISRVSLSKRSENAPPTTASGQEANTPAKYRVSIKV
ncbi:hypothetical protein G7Y89_g14874 [Cudoniella acicularis]|uniref:Uncharacterized protein n=1 Tax=Cudoniella acicularis TaxID=354080 RepID=A0A8H4VT27_9HELO|nr:hypothetical protein G7Y89_g14874 [Cudoniella acicularis]